MDVGVPPVLEAGVPLCLVELAQRGLDGDLRCVLAFWAWHAGMACYFR